MQQQAGGWDCRDSGVGLLGRIGETSGVSGVSMLGGVHGVRRQTG